MKKLLILLVLIVAGCQQSATVLTQADMDAIQKNIEGFTQAIIANSPDIGNGYAEDAVSLPPHEQEVIGKQKIVEFHSQPGPKVISFTITSQEMDGTGSTAYSRGTWTFKGTVNDSIEVNDNGKYLLILKKQPDGAWKVTREIWNSNLPLPGQ